VIKTALLLSVLALATTANAETYSKVNPIKNITVGSGMIRVRLADNTGSFEPCAIERDWYYLELNSTTPGMKEMYAAILSAKASGQNVFLQLSGCISGYSVIKHVYMCDSLFCP
jgi:hypothetical protein